MSTQDPYQPNPGSGWQPTPNPSGPGVPDQYAQPANGQAPADPYGQPAYGQPAYGQPAYGEPAFAQPTYGQPAYAQPSYAQPGYGQAAPAYGTPAPFGAPTDGMPTYGAPVVGYPGYFVGYGVVHAPWIQRVGAYMLDSLAILPYFAGLLVMSVVTEPGFDRYGTPTDQPTATGAIAFGVGALASLVLWGWNRWVRGGRTGQSWGKKAVGLTMQGDATGAPIGVWMAFVRDIAHYVDGFFYLGYLWPLWDAKRQTFSDKLTKTVVVR